MKVNICKVNNMTIKPNADTALMALIITCIRFFLFYKENIKNHVRPKMKTASKR